MLEEGLHGKMQNAQVLVVLTGLVVVFPFPGAPQQGRLTKEI